MKMQFRFDFEYDTKLNANISKQITAIRAIEKSVALFSMFARKEKKLKLVISVKPSVAQSIAAVIGAKQRGDGYLEGGGYLVSWCLGHLAELASADAYDEKYAKWRREDLPILPEDWRFTVSGDKQKQFNISCALMRRDDVSEVINACDAGREGELIFRTVYEHGRLFQADETALDFLNGG